MATRNQEQKQTTNFTFLLLSMLFICDFILIAVVASGLAMRWAYSFDWTDAGPLWTHVIATLSAYKAFLIVMIVAFWVRAKKFKIKK